MVWAFLAGLLLLNGLPHLVKGICGRPHMTPFKRVSPAWLNVLWGWANWIVGAIFLRLALAGGWTLGDCVAFAVGGMGVSLYLSLFWSREGARLPWHRD